ncbi:YaaR family protein [Pseudothermotoga thermarum]|uniref:DUF327 domain-containing protein n=1 Tax=Pseudothermotoga thermarum DSM 5069 TaxID=688269 RepID=F7YX46_9THEM|nr:YaaR family protein [Pseudothermotoga thermarum]AEH50857.1 protein of unknown function DUF327 [Pseudothermotoga thermarum DSM 5069]
MRINPPEDWNLRNFEVKRKKISRSTQKKVESNSLKFSEVFEIVEEETLNEILEDLIKRIVDCGNKLVRSPTQENFKRYRESVKEFLKLVEKKLYKMSKDFQASTDLFVVVEEVDEKLQQIAQSLLEAEKGALNLAAKVQEIYGLLMDLYR